MRRVLVVCTANQCRSPMAEGLIRHRMAAASGAEARLHVSSAGTWTTPDRPPTREAVEAMAERGIDIADIRSIEADAESLSSADIVLVMTEGHRQSIAAEFPDVAYKVRLFSSLGGGSYDIADPVGGTLDDYRATADELERLVEDGWSVIAAEAAVGD